MFSGFSVAPKWLETNLQITELVIQDVKTINEIEANAFAGQAFKNLQALELINMRLDYFQKNMLNGLISLHTLHVTQMEFQFIEENCLAAVPHLRSILFEAISDQVIDVRNLTGTMTLDLMQIVSLRENNLENSINENTFFGLSNIKSLFLTNSKICSIGSKSFDRIQRTIQLIDLRGNHLRTLPDGLLLQLLMRNDVKISLSKNRWRCNCDLVALRKLIISKPLQFEDVNEVKCSQPKELVEQAVASAWFCCQDADKSQYGSCIGEDTEMHPVLTAIRCSYTEIPNLHIKFKITKNLVDSQFIINLQDITSDLALVSFASANSTIKLFPYQSLRCWTHIKRTMKIKIDNIQNRFVFCFMNRTTANFFPLTCQTVHMLNDNFSVIISGENLSFISYVLIAISVCVVTFILSVLIGVILKLFLMASFNLMKRKYTTCSSRTLSICRPHTISEIEENYKESSYISVIPPSPYDKINWQMEAKSTVCNENEPDEMYSYADRSELNSSKSIRTRRSPANSKNNQIKVDINIFHQNME